MNQKPSSWQIQKVKYREILLMRNKNEKPGAPNDDFFLNVLKTLFRVSRELLDL